MKKHHLLCLLFLSFLYSCKNKQETKLENVTKEVTEKALTVAQLKGKTISELRILRNEICARKGYVFKDSVLHNYFAAKTWYKPNKEVKIILSNIEKENIAFIKETEKTILPFKIPAGSEIVKTLSIDFDKDETPDTVQLVKNTKSGNFEQAIYIYLSKNKTREKIDLQIEDEFNETHAFVNTKDHDLRFGYTIPGTGLFSYEFELRYNSKLENFQLVSYTSSYRLGYAGYGGKKYNLNTGDYEVFKEMVGMDDTSKKIVKNEHGNQKTKVITPDLINGELYEYLDLIGNEFNEDFTITNCKATVIKNLVLEFEYGALSYLGEYIMFKKELTDFLKSIKIDKTADIEIDNYSKSYKLHRNWDLEYIKEDECEDELFLTFDMENNAFVIQINNCSLFKEDGDSHISEQSTMFEFEIGNNCTYKFKRVNGAG